MDNAFTLDFPCGWRTSKFPRGGMTWPKIDIENQLTGGLHAPVDPVGAALGAREGVKAIIIDGRNMKNFGALLNGREFKGTIIG